MRKVTKILAKLLSAIVLLLIILPLMLSLSLSLPFVQNFAMQRVASFLEYKVGSRLSVGEIRFTMLREFTIHDLMVEDMVGDTMIYAREVAARLDNYSLLGKSIVVEKLSVNEGDLRLREMPDGQMNIKLLLDKFSNPDKEKVFRTVIGDVQVKDLDVEISRIEHQNPTTGVDVANIRLDGIVARGRNFVSQSGIMELSVLDFEARERTGLEIEHFSGDVVVYQGVVDLSEAKVTTPTSRLNLPRLRLEGESWDQYKDFTDQVSIELLSQESVLSVSDVAYFAPALWGKSFELREFSGSANGTVNNLDVRLSSLAFGAESSLEATVAVIGVEDLPSATFELDIERLETNVDDINLVSQALGGVTLGSSEQKIVRAMGDFSINSQIEGSLEDMSATLALDSPLGSALYEGVVRGASTSAPLWVEGTFGSQGFNVGQLLAVKQLGVVSMSSEVRYKELGGSMLDAAINGLISSVEYNSCNYSSISLEGSFDGQTIESRIVSGDEKLDFNMASIINLSDDRHYDLTLRLNRVDLCAMNINHRDSLSRLSGSLRVNLGGNSIEDLSGSVIVRNVNYNYNEDKLYTPTISLTARNSESSKYIDLRSDFVDMTFNSKGSFQMLFDYIKDGMRTYIPMLYTEDQERAEQRKVTIVDNYSTLNVDFKNSSQLSQAVLSGLDIADNSSINLIVNPSSKRFSMRLESDYIQHNSFAATNLSVNASNDNDSLSLYATSADIYLGRTTFSSYSLAAGVRNNTVELSTGFRDLATETSATLGMQVLFEDATTAKISIHPSNITMGADKWLITADNIVGRGGVLQIDDFKMVNGSQQLTADGVISRSPSDSLMLTLNNYDISMITSVVSDMGYSVEGLSSGYVNMRELLGSAQVRADVSLDSVSVNSIPSPALRLMAGWDTSQNRAGVTVTNRHNRDTVMTGYYAPSSNRYYARLKVDSLNMGLIDPLLTTTISGTKGYADVDVSLSGQGRKASLQGLLEAYDLSTKILYTQVDYSIPSATITVSDNVFSSQAQKMYDSQGNSGLVTLFLSLDQLSNVTYRLRVVPDNMMVLNTTEQDNELFYGTIYATGVATIEGDKRGVNMDITATSEPNSSLVMPLSTQSAVANTDFITFVQERSSGQEVGSSSVNFRRNYTQERERERAQASRLNINMALHATPDMDFQLVIDPVVGDVIKAKGEGRLNLNIAPQDNIFEMYGDYNITEGNYLFMMLNPISKRFVVENDSSIQWTGDPIDPILNIDAVYKVKTSLDPLINSTSNYSSESSSRAVPVDCIIHLSDRLMQPSVTFDIEVPTADTEQQTVIANTLIDQETISQQFFYLMFANSFVPVSSSYGGVSSSTAASTGFELLTNQLSNWLSSSDYNMVIRYRPGSDTELTSDEVDLGFSRGLMGDRLLIEVEGNYIAENTTSTEENFSNFMGEAYITWLIDKGGALKLKGFSQVIDRYDENQGLQETGIGVYYSESFENFKDLKRRVRDRFRRRAKDEDDDDDDGDDDEEMEMDENNENE